MSDPKALAKKLLWQAQAAPPSPFLEWDSLNNLMAAIAPINYDTAGRPQSTNIEDRTMIGRQSALTGPGVNYAGYERGPLGQRVATLYAQQQAMRDAAALKPISSPVNHHARPIRLPSWLK